MLQKLEVDKHLVTYITDIKFQTLIFYRLRLLGAKMFVI